MDIWKTIKFNVNQIFATVEKHIKISTRFKFNLIMGYIQPVFQIFLPIILMNSFFDYNPQFGPWTRENYIVYLFIGYTIILFQRIITYIPGEFSAEKFWNTLSALMVAPYSKFNLLIGIMISHLIMISIPFLIFLIICLLFFPISIITLIFILLMAIAVLLILSGIGLIVGVFAISNENIRRILVFFISLIFVVSCIAYPYELFPVFIQKIINLNPIYYIIDILRLTWIENNIILTIRSHPIHFLIFLSLLISFPSIGILMFNYIFKKYGIVGY